MERVQELDSCTNGESKEARHARHNAARTHGTASASSPRATYVLAIRSMIAAGSWNVVPIGSRAVPTESLVVLAERSGVEALVVVVGISGTSRP